MGSVMPTWRMAALRSLAVCRSPTGMAPSSPAFPAVRGYPIDDVDFGRAFNGALYAGSRLMVPARDTATGTRGDSCGYPLAAIWILVASLRRQIG